LQWIKLKQQEKVKYISKVNCQCLSGEGRKGQAFWIRKRCTDWFWFIWLSLSLWACVQISRSLHVRTSAWSFCSSIPKY